MQCFLHFHTTSTATLRVKTEGEVGSQTTNGYINLKDVLGDGEKICATNDAPIYVVFTDSDGSLQGAMVQGSQVVVGEITVVSGEEQFTAGGSCQAIKIVDPSVTGYADFVQSADKQTVTAGNDYTVFVDYYLDKKATNVDELQIAADNFAGNYYVEADTLFRRKSDGVDMPANLTFPNVKIQSNFTFSLSGTGDPSTFTFTMDALPGYTYFDKSREVLCVIQVVEDQNNATKTVQPVMPHNTTLEHKKDEIEDSKYIGYWAGAAGGGTSGNADN